MSKQYEHWCDKKYQAKESNFDTGDLARKLVDTLTDWVLCDTAKLTEDMPNVELKRRRMQKLLDTSEQIECIVNDANSIYAIYLVDFAERRRKFLIARGLCFQLTTMLGHIVKYAAPETNIQKYLDLQNDIKNIGGKIKNIMIKDDKKRKEKMKQY